MIELEVKELIARHKSDMSEKGSQIGQLEELNQQLTASLDQKMAEKEELMGQIKNLQEGLYSQRSERIVKPPSTLYLLVCPFFAITSKRAFRDTIFRKCPPNLMIKAKQWSDIQTFQDGASNLYCPTLK